MQQNKKPTTSTITHYSQYNQNTSNLKNILKDEGKMPMIRYGKCMTSGGYGGGQVKIDRNMAYVDKLKLMLTNNPKYNQLTQNTTLTSHLTSHQQTQQTIPTSSSNKKSPLKQPLNGVLKTQPRIRHQRTQSHFTTLNYLNTSTKQLQYHNVQIQGQGSFCRSRSKGLANAPGQVGKFERSATKGGNKDYGKGDVSGSGKKNNGLILNQIKTDLLIGKKRVVSTNGNLTKAIYQSRLKLDSSSNLTKNRIKYQIINYTKFSPFPRSLCLDIQPSSTLPAQRQSEQDLKICKKWGKMQLLQVLGSGANASVRQAINNNTSYAVKIYQKYKLLQPKKKKRVYSQIELLHNLPSHPNIITMYQAFEDKRQIHVIMQHIENSITLHQYFRNKMLQMDIGEIRKIFGRVVRAIGFLVQNGVAHRDVKPDNVLISWGGQGSGDMVDQAGVVVKVIDFGFALKGSVSDFHCGTPNFMAPELLQKGSKYGTFAVDVWALGVMLFYLCEGRYPFRGYDQRDLYKNIKKGVYEFNRIQDQRIKQIIDLTLQVDPNKRITVKQLLKKEWLWDV